MRWSTVDKKLVREYRERYRIVAEVELQEQKTATIGERWRQLNALWNLANELGVRSTPDDVNTVRRRWVKIMEQHERT